MVSRLMNDRVSESRACGNVALILRAQRLFNDALVFANRQIAIAQTVEDQRYLAHGLYNLGAIYISRANQLKLKNTGSYKDVGAKCSGYCSNLHQAFACYCKCIRIYLNLSDRFGCGRVYGCLGNVLHMLGEYKSAAEYHGKRLSIAFDLHDDESKYKSYINLGNAYILLSDARTAAEFYRSALKIAKESFDKQREAKCCFCLACASYISQDYDGATLYYFSSLTLFRELKDLVGLCRTYGSLAALYTMLPDYPKAAYFLLCSRATAIQIHDEGMVTTAVKSLTRLVEKHRDVLILEGGYINLDSSDDVEPQVHFCRLKTVSRSISFIFNKPSSGYVHFNDATHERRHSLESANAEHMKSDDAFFDLVSRVQSSRLDEQRCDMSVLSSKDNAGRRQTDCTKTAQNVMQFHSSISKVSLNVNEVIPNDSESNSTTEETVRLLKKERSDNKTTGSTAQHSRKSKKSHLNKKRSQARESLIDLLMDTQGRRMDEQRATLLPGLTNKKQTLELVEKLGAASDEGNDAKVDEALIDLLMNAQRQRMDDQRTDLTVNNNTPVVCGSLEDYSAEDDLSEMVMRMQAGRLEDQRAHLKTSNKP
ncbi:hypothetical protein KIN20_005006 [Parelaphostrongylus tenuis]|uniref:Uncharacterized protein n=1 Tax=Parelaphostrongylus tenuis TaxID=148309 RepID=A0AAD5M2I9_PARTN|nr:hypothetical protein KIN20_005006 [Parelaphostrongylus tenuis]